MERTKLGKKIIIRIIIIIQVRKYEQKKSDKNMIHHKVRGKKKTFRNFIIFFLILQTKVIHWRLSFSTRCHFAFFPRCRFRPENFSQSSKCCHSHHAHFQIDLSHPQHLHHFAAAARASQLNAVPRLLLVFSSAAIFRRRWFVRFRASSRTARTGSSLSFPSADFDGDSAGASPPRRRRCTPPIGVFSIAASSRGGGRAGPGSEGCRCRRNPPAAARSRARGHRLGGRG